MHGKGRSKLRSDDRERRRECPGEYGGIERVGTDQSHVERKVEIGRATVWLPDEVKGVSPFKALPRKRDPAIAERIAYCAKRLRASATDILFAPAQARTIAKVEGYAKAGIIRCRRTMHQVVR